MCVSSVWRELAHLSKRYALLSLKAQRPRHRHRVASSRLDAGRGYRIRRLDVEHEAGTVSGTHSDNNLCRAGLLYKRCKYKQPPQQDMIILPPIVHKDLVSLPGARVHASDGAGARCGGPSIIVSSFPGFPSPGREPLPLLPRCSCPQQPHLSRPLREHHPPGVLLLFCVDVPLARSRLGTALAQSGRGRTRKQASPTVSALVFSC